jgi:hypothetical protein
MNLENLYKNIKNPLQDLEVLKKLIDMYSNSTSNDKSFYSKLIGYDFGLNKVSFDSKNNFFAFIFNNWKKEILNMKKEDFIELKAQGRLNDDFIFLRDYLKNIGDVKKIEDIYKIENGIKENYIKLLLKKYNWRGPNENSSGWLHVNSYHTNKWNQEKLAVSHRLYLNPDPKDLYDFVIIMIKKFNEKKLPHYFKFSNTGNREDSIVLYSDHERLDDYIKVLLEIKSENLDIINRFKMKPILTGNINSFISYGSEPNQSNFSYTSLRAELIERALDIATIKWLIENQNRTFKYQNKELTLKEIINTDATIKFVESIKEKDEDFKRIDCKVLNNKLLPIIMTLNNKIFKQIFNKEKNIKDERIRFSNDKVFTYGYTNISNLLRSNVVKITKIDPNFYYKVKNEIEDLSEEYGIDKENFCFNSDIKSLIKNNQKKKTV